MNLGLDIRCLLESQLSGVSQYTLNILMNLPKNAGYQFFLFSNSYKKNPTNSFPDFSHLHSRLPNKIFNAGQLVGLPIIDYLIRNSQIDRFWLPNLNFFNSKLPFVLT